MLWHLLHSSAVSLSTAILVGLNQPEEGEGSPSTQGAADAGPPKHSSQRSINSTNSYPTMPCKATTSSARWTSVDRSIIPEKKKKNNNNPWIYNTPLPTHTSTHKYIFLFITSFSRWFFCVCMCVCVFYFLERNSMIHAGSSSAGCQNATFG